MTNYTFHPDYVDPYYLLLMNANFVIRPDEIPGLFNGLKKIEKELDNIQLTHMLQSSWRPSKVAAWIIGLNQKVELEDELINTLHKTTVYIEHLIFALTLLNTEKSIGSIESFIQLKTDSMRKNFDWLRLDIMGFDWAIAAIVWLDKQNNTNKIEKTLQVWDAFKKDSEVFEKKYRLQIDKWVRVDETAKVFDAAMALAKLHR